MTGKGQRVAGRYLLETELGAGGMGVVWRARDERLGRDVAVKLLAANALGNSAARTRLMREARAAGRLQHEGIVHVYDVGETDDGGAFLVMELVPGHTLRIWQEQGKLTIDQRIEFVLAIAAALSCAHESGVIHRDIKPDNVIVRSNGSPVLLDFGLAKPVTTPLIEALGPTGDSLQLTGTGHIVGTPAYLAPEQVSGTNVGPASDQFSLAVMTFELLTGRLPWKGATVIEVLASMLHEPPLSARELVPELPAELDAVLQRALSKEAEQRFPSVAAFAEALRQLFPDVPVAHMSTLPPLVAEPRKPVSRSDRASGSAERGVERGVAVPPNRKGNTLKLALLGAGVAAILGGAAVAQRASRDGAAPTSSASAQATVLAPSAVVACPLFELKGELPPGTNGFLAAAAGALACDRVQALLGGASERTLAPAELLPGIPREPTEHAPPDPFGAADVPKRTVEAAKKQADAYVDGTLEKTQLDFAVELTLRTRDGRALGVGRGRGEELFEAVSAAIRDARAVFGNGAASAFQQEWFGATTTEAAIDVLDVTTALITETDLATSRACERAARQAALRPSMAFLLRAICHERLQRTPLPDEPPPIDASTTGAFVTTIAAQRMRGGAIETKKRVEMLRAQQNAPKSPQGRAILLATIAELLYNVGDLAGAQSASRLAGQLVPKLVDPRGTPWHRLTFATEFGRAISRVHESWMPWEPTAIANSGSREDGFAARITISQKTQLLCRHGYYAQAYGELLAASGNTEAARNIAEQLNDDYLRLRATLGAARYKRALEDAVRMLRELPAADLNAGKAFRLASVGAEAARYLGRPAEFMDDVVKRYLEPEPPHVRVGVMPFFALVYSCLEAPAPVARRCFRRLRQVYARGDVGGVVGTVPLVLDGADRWLAGDIPGAAKAWRPMMRHNGNLGEAAFRHVVATAFDRSDMSEIAARVDARFVELVEAPDAIDLAFARAAIRAEKDGKLEQARKLAQVCVDRWQHADDDVPARREMQALLKRNSRTSNE